MHEKEDQKETIRGGDAGRQQPQLNLKHVASQEVGIPVESGLCPL